MNQDNNHPASDSTNNKGSSESKIQNLPLKLVLATVLMFGFGFALVPLYDVFCDITGINGKGFERQPLSQTEATYPQAIETTQDPLASQEESTARKVTVQFIANPQTGFSGDFYPQSTQLSAAVDKSVTTAYVARNATENNLKLQAIPSISPAEASSYVTKMECFCFQQQSLEAGQEREMGLTFSISSELPEHIHKVTFSYSLYPLEDEDKQQQASDTTDSTTTHTTNNTINNTATSTQLNRTFPSAETMDQITGGKHHEPNA